MNPSRCLPAQRRGSTQLVSGQASGFVFRDEDAIGLRAAVVSRVVCGSGRALAGVSRLGGRAVFLPKMSPKRPTADPRSLIVPGRVP